MKAVLQRVTHAAVRVGDETTGEIGPGLVVLLGVARGDTAEDAGRLAARIASLRLFREGDRHFHLSLLESGGEALVVSQFTLLADVSHGRRPDFTAAERGELAAPLVDAFVAALRALGVRVAEGRFGAEMDLEIHNHGPVTIEVASR